MQLSFDTYTTIQTPTNMPRVIRAADFLQAQLNSLDNAGIIIPQEQRTEREQIISDQRNFKPDNWNRYDTDWKNATISNSAFMTNHSVTLAGGSKDIKYFGAVTSLNQDGLIANNNFNRLNIRLNTDADINKWLKFRNEISYRVSNQSTPALSTPRNIISKSLYFDPTLSAVRELDGNWGYGKNGDNPVANAEDSGTLNVARPIAS